MGDRFELVTMGRGCDIEKILTFDDIPVSGRGFVADPFLTEANGREYILFEVLVRDPKEKFIGYATRDEYGNWQYQGRALEDDRYFFSFPYVFEHDGEHYMVPCMSYSDGSPCPQVVYQADEYPISWQPKTEFEFGCSDAVVLEHEGSWFLICTHNGGVRLYHSETPFGHWKEHPHSPLSTCGQFQRMAGSPIRFEDELYLVYQDCEIHYGEKVRCCRVDKLSESEFAQTEIDASPLTSGQYTGDWNHLGMHHIDFNSPHSFAVVDGHTREGWSIGAVEVDNITDRLVPAPSEFSVGQKFRREIETTNSRIRAIEQYRQDNGSVALLKKGIGKVF